MLANAEFMAQHLLAFGWDTVVVDIDWSDPSARSHGYNADAPLHLDSFGRLIPDPGRFPSSANGAGFAPLAARVHELGLKFGIHIMRGIPRLATAADLPISGSSATAAEVADSTNRCEWNPDMDGLSTSHPASQDYYDSIVSLYAAWGVDFIKADDLLWPYQAADIEALSLAIERSGRRIELSLSPGRDLSLTRLDHLREHATMWRICDDLWDNWADVEANWWRPCWKPAFAVGRSICLLERAGQLLLAEKSSTAEDGSRPMLPWESFRSLHVMLHCRSWWEPSPSSVSETTGRNT